MRVTRSIVNVDDHQQFCASLLKVKVGESLALPPLLPALHEDAVLHCTAVKDGLYTFDLSFFSVPLGVVEILHDHDVLAITLEEK